jgi:hypothetical protein
MTPRAKLSAPTTATSGAAEFPGPKAFAFARVKLTVPVVEFKTPTAPEAVPPVAIPTMLQVPVEPLLPPLELPPVPPVTFPVMFTVPVAAFLTPIEKFPLPPVQFPVTFKIPVETFSAEYEFAPDDAEQFPVMVKVPVDAFTAPIAVLTVPPVTFPTIDAVDGEAAVNCRQLREAVADLLVTLAVSVTPSFSVKMPVPALETSSQVTLAVMVTVWPVAARASSPTPGTTPPVHVAPALKLPLAAEVMRAMA